MAAFLLWLILLIICWPLAILALLLYPLLILSSPFLRVERPLDLSQITTFVDPWV